MTELDPLQHLRELPLPVVPEQLSARIRERAHAELRSRSSAERPLRRALAFAAVVVLCAGHLGWTVAFLTKMNAPVIATRAYR
jgi:hypothetical protein